MVHRWILGLRPAVYMILAFFPAALEASTAALDAAAATLARAIKSEDVVTLRRQASRSGPMQDLFLLHAGSSLLKAGKSEAGEALLKQVPAGPSQARALRLEVQSLVARGKHAAAAARTASSGATELSPVSREQAQLLQAKTFRKLGKHVEADSLFLGLAGGRRKGAASREAVQELYRRYRAGRFVPVPSKPSALLEFAQVLFDHRRYAHVIDLSNRVVRATKISSKEEIGRGYMLLGKVYEKKKNRWFSARCYGDAVRFLPPGHALIQEASYHRGALFIQLKRPKKARAEFAKVLTKPGSFRAGARWHLAQLDLKAKQRARAIATFEKLAKEDPKSYFAPKALWRVARLREKHGSFQQTKDAFLAFPKAYPAHRLANAARFRAGEAAYAGKAVKTARAIWTSCVETPFVPDLYSLFASQRLAGVKRPSFAGRKGPGWARLLARYPRGMRGLPLWEAPGTEIPVAAKHRIEALRSYGLWEDLHGDLSYWTDRPEGKQHSTRHAYAWAAFRAGKYQDCVRVFEAMLAKPASVRPNSRAGFFSGLFPRAYGATLGKEAGIRNVTLPLILSIAREESHFAPDLQSWAGARGLMQVMPSTGKWIAEMLGRKSAGDLYQPEVAAEMGAWYLAHLSKMFRKRSETEILSIAGYNGGPGNVRRWLKSQDVSDIIAFLDTMDREETFYYVYKVTRSMMAYEAAESLERSAALGDTKGELPTG